MNNQPHIENHIDLRVNITVVKQNVIQIERHKTQKISFILHITVLQEKIYILVRILFSITIYENYKEYITYKLGKVQGIFARQKNKHPT